MPSPLYRPSGLRWAERLAPDRAVFFAKPSRARAFLTAPFGLLLLPFVVMALLWQIWILALVLTLAAATILASAGTRLFGCARFTLGRDGFALAFEVALGRPVREPIENVDGFDVAQVGPEFLSTANATPWMLRLLTKDGRAVRLEIPIDDVEHLRFVAARLNEALETIKAPAGYRR